MDEYGYPRSDEEIQNSYSYSSSQTNYHTSSSSYKYSNENGDDNSDPQFTQDDYSRPNPNHPQPPGSKHNPNPHPVGYGGLATHHSENIPGNEFFLHVDPTVDQDQPDFELSNCRGKKRALLIGINYFGTKNQLNGCINDVANIKQFLTSLYGFQEEDMVILTDEREEEKFIPTRKNIIAAMEWLVHDAEPDDSFFFHYSGHGGRVHDVHSDEDDNFDETIYPLDFESYEGESGQLKDDDMHNLLVKPLPPKCRLTCIFDSCHSGTVLDLPYVYSTRGEIKERNLFKHAGKGIFSAGIAYARGDKDGALSSIMSLGKELMESRKASSQARRQNASQADVVMFSGCKDDQTSADASEAGKATGAMSHALTSTLRENPHQSYQELLNSLRDILRDKYSQRPQLSSSHPIDVNLKFQC